MTRPNKLECLYLAITFQSSQTFAVNTRSLPKKEASERPANWVCSGLAVNFLDPKGFPRPNPLAYWASSSVMKEKKFYNIDTSGLYYKTFRIVIYNRNPSMAS